MNIHMDIDLSPGSSSAVGASQAPDLVRERQTVLPGLPPQSAGDDAPSELRSTYHDSFGGSGGFTAPLKRYQRAGQQVQLVRPVPPQSREPQHTMMADNTRISSLEDRLINQERASQNILDRAMRIKEDVIENLNITHSTWQGEKRQRELLQEHIRSITELVRKMDKDIKVLEEQIRIKDSYLAGSGNAIKSLEIQQATSLTDMRGRIARCDAAIAKLALDVQKCQDGQSGASGNQQVSYQRLQDKIQALEIKVAESTQKIERNNTESLIKAQSKENNMARDSAVLETKLKSSVEELKLLMNSQKQANDAERERSISRITVDSEKQQGLVKERLEKLELRVDLALEKLDGQVRGLRSSTDVKDVQRQQVDMERRVTEMVNNLTLQQNEAFLKLKKECRQGFSTVHDSITNSKHVLEGKLTLSEEQLRKEIGHVKKMVVLV